MAPHSLLVRSVPCYRLDIGEDVTAVPPMPIDLLDSLGHRGVLSSAAI